MLVLVVQRWLLLLDVRCSVMNRILKYLNRFQSITQDNLFSSSWLLPIICLSCETLTNEPMELAEMNNFHRRRPHRGSNSFDPKLTLTTELRNHISRETSPVIQCSTPWLQKLIFYSNLKNSMDIVPEILRNVLMISFCDNSSTFWPFTCQIK